MRKHTVDETNWAAEAYQFVSAGILDDKCESHGVEVPGLDERQPETAEGDLQNTFEQLAERYMNA